MITHFCGSGETDSKVMIDHRYIVLSQQYIKLHKICSLQTFYIPLQSHQWFLYLVISVCMCTFYIPLQPHQWCLYLVISVCMCMCVSACVHAFGHVCMQACICMCVFYLASKHGRMVTKKQIPRKYPASALSVYVAPTDILILGDFQPVPICFQHQSYQIPYLFHTQAGLVHFSVPFLRP